MKIHGNTHEFNFYNEHHHIFGSPTQDLETTFQNKNAKFGSICTF
jgi:hypothetical protein